MSAGHRNGDRLDLLDPLIYADAFDCSLTLGELWRYGRVAIDQPTLERRLREDSGLRKLVLSRDGLYCLADRPALIDQRPARARHARRLERRARWVTRVLRNVPFVRGVALTGSAAADDAAADADVDLLVIVARARLGTVFLLLGSVSRLLGRRLFCPNYYLCEDNLAMAPASLYVARELAQARVLDGDAAILWQSNPWLAEIFPNAAPAVQARSGRSRSAPLQALLEAPLRRKLGDRVERHARRVGITRLGVHYRGRGEDVPPQVVGSFESGAALRFHGGQIAERSLERYFARRASIAGRLEVLDREREPAARTLR
jgi:predicted nucleotidyltransferase